MIYLYASPSLPPDELSLRAPGEKLPFGRDEWRCLSALLILSLPVTFFWATYEQQGNTIALWASDYTDRSVNLIFWTWQIPVTWFQSFNPFMIFAFTPFIIALWARQARSGSEPSTVAKMAHGCFYNAVAHLILFGAALYAGPRQGELALARRLLRRCSPSASFICRRPRCRWCRRSRRRIACR